MEVVSNTYMPGDPRLVEQLVYELKSQGIFDQFRKECIADVDTKPAYQNLRQRVEGSVTSFLGQQTWKPDMNKNQVREQLRKNIYESGYLETGVERIVDQVVNPKINAIFLPQVEDVVYRYLGIEKPNRSEVKKELKIDVTDLLPTDLEAISPESDHTKDDSFNFNDSVNSETKMEEDESPPFEPIDVQNSNIQHEENSVDSHLSGFSGLQSHDSNPCPESKICQMELSNQDSQVSQNSSESRLSIITSEDNTKMEIREDSNSKLIKTSDSSSQMEMPPMEETTDPSPIQKDEESKPVSEVEVNISCNVVEEKNLEEQENEKQIEKVTDIIKTKQTEEKQHEDKKYEKKNGDKKSRSSDKYSSKDKRDEKHRKSSSSSNRDKEKSSSKYSSSSSSKDKDKYRDKKESRSSSSNNNNKEKNDRDDNKNDKEKIKNDKDKDKAEKEKDKDKKEKDKYEKDKTDKSKSNKDKDKSLKDKDKAKSCGSSSSSSINKHSSNKEKEKNSSSLKSDSSKKDKEKLHLSSSSSSKESKSKSSDSKSKSSSSDKHKRDEKGTHSISIKHSSSSSSSNSSKRDKDNKDKKRVSKKDVKDDHYSSKYKKSDRRSTDRDSNDGRSSKQSHINSFTDNNSSQTQKSNQESSSSNSGSGSGDSGTSDQTEHVVRSPVKIVEPSENNEVSMSSLSIDALKFKYIKPKFASNFQEARKLMKIRKQLAKLERQNQLSLAQIEVSSAEAPIVNGVGSLEKEGVETEEKPKEKVESIEIIKDFSPKVETDEISQCKMSPKDDSLLLQSKELSKENWEALEARLAQEMSNINYDSYESPYDDDFGECNSIDSKKSLPNVSENCVVEEKIKVSVHCDPEVQEKETEQLHNLEVPSEVRNITDETEKVNVSDNIPEGKDDGEQSKESVQKSLEQNKDDQGEAEKVEIGNNDKTKTTENAESENNSDLKVDDQMIIDDNEKISNIDGTVSDSDTSGPCTYLDPPSPGFNRNLQFLYKYIETLEQEVEHSVKTFQNNFIPAKQKLGKRKLADMKNNNKAHYEQTIEVKKRRRSVLPNPNSLISKANKEKLCNSSDISPNESFSLPLSPAESDKSNDKKDEDSPKAKQKRESIVRTIHTRSQRYSSEDLYKPRPIFMGSRRSRGAKNVEK